MFAKFLNPRNDLAFKRVFGAEKNKDILIHFLNDIFGRTINPIEEVTFLKPVQEPEIVSQRLSVVDLLCEDLAGDRFIVEMQVNSEPGFEKRAQYYAARAYIEQREKGLKYADLKSVTFLAITDFNLFPNDDRYLTHHVTLDKETHEHQLKDFSFSFLELPKFKRAKHQLKTITEKWAYFFKHAEDTTEADLELIVGSDQIIRRAYAELSRFSWSEAELMEYESVDMKRAADQAILEGAEAKGRAEGRAEGEAKGRAEKLQIANKLLAKGMTINDVADLMGMTVEELEAVAE